MRRENWVLRQSTRGASGRHIHVCGFSNCLYPWLRFTASVVCSLRGQRNALL